MERINPTQTVNKHRQRSSETEAIAAVLTDEKREKLGDVIDRWRLNLGWRPLDDASQEMAIQSWANVLDSERVPPEAYNELFNRALQLRALMFSQGKDAPKFGVELMLACWIGPNGLRSEARQREIGQDRTLTANAESVCQHCFGTGWRRTEDGYGVGTVSRCDHSELKQ